MPPSGRSRSTGGSQSRSPGSRASSRSTASRSTASRGARGRGGAGGGGLTAFESKLGEVLGLAMAAKGATQRVAKLTEDGTLRQTLERMGKEAAETEERTTQVAGAIGRKGPMRKKARETRQEAEQMMKAYLGRDADALDGFEFLTMAEAGEVGHWAIVREMNKKVKNKDVAELVKWVTPIQKRHYDDVLKGSLAIAAEEDPNATE